MKLLWNYLKQLFATLTGRSSTTEVVEPLPAADSQGRHGRESEPRRAHRMGPEEDPMLNAFAWMFGARKRRDQEVHFRPVGPDGIASVETEEVRREGNSLRFLSTRTVVITCSGELVRPETLRAVCWECSGYEATLFRCQCGRTLCQLHARRFETPDGAELILCAEHFQQASVAYDTWAAHDAQQPSASRKSA
jgi:hypothetical protein